MLWSKKNEDDDKRIYKECLEMYLSTKKDDSENNDIYMLYSKIKEDYSLFITRDKNFIISERIRLIKNVGKYSSPYMNNRLGLIIGITSGSFILFFESMKVFDSQINGVPNIISKILSSTIIVIVFLLITSYVIKSLDDKFSRKSKKEAIINHISLRALDDIEKDRAVENTAKEEAAVTIQDEQSKELTKHTLQQGNGNWNISISETSVLEMAKGIYSAAKFIRKVISKKKK